VVGGFVVSSPGPSHTASERLQPDRGGRHTTHYDAECAAWSNFLAGAPWAGQNADAAWGTTCDTGSMSERSPQEHVDGRIRVYYGTEFDESDRLVGRSGQGVLEFERTQQIVCERVIAGSRIIDIGGASGVHAARLADRGYEVLLIDPVPRHVEAASTHGTFTAVLGDARSLPVDDHGFDAALLLGPLYHLVDRRDRLRAWSEAIRVVRPGGWVFAAGVSRLSAMAWVTVVEPSIALANTGVATTRSPMPEKWRRLIEEGAGELGPTGFPGGHFHLADDLEREALDAGLRDVRTVGLEGPGAQAIEISRSHDRRLIAAARTLAEAYESQPGLRDLSPHLLAFGRVPVASAPTSRVHPSGPPR
jgi:SAM-dependent methyltransferase